MKLCRKCNIEKEDISFRKQSRICRACENIKTKEWRKNNPEKYKAQKNRWRSKDNSKKILARCRQNYKERNKERVKEFNRQWVLRNWDKVYAYQKGWQKKTGHVSKMNKRKVDTMTNCYLVECLKSRGFTKEDVIKFPFLMDVQKIKNIIRRANKLINSKKQTNE
jgi:hypothetical protein